MLAKNHKTMKGVNSALIRCFATCA